MERAIKIKPDYYEAWLNRGRAFRYSENRDALTFYDRAFQISLEDPELWRKRGYGFFYSQVRDEAAFFCWDKYLESYPNDWKIWRDHASYSNLRADKPQNLS